MTTQEKLNRLDEVDFTGDESKSSEYNYGSYTVNEDGVHLGEKCIIPQALLITERFEDIESGFVKLELAFYNKTDWKYITINNEITANKNKIVILANHGLMVTSENAIGIVRYLLELQTLNDIPTQQSVSHLGFVGKRFVPYDTDLIYTGDMTYSDIYKAINSKGELDEWVSLYHEVRNDSLAARAVTASSFASPLLHILDKLSFFTHISGNSGTGKTVALRFAASVWGNPETYMMNLSGTKVGFERTAYFYHNFPLILDELQTIKNINLAEVIYMLTQGQGKIRGTTNGGVEPLLNWRLCNITSGEQPLTRENSNTGEINRIIDIYVRDRVFNDPKKVYDVSNENYGHVGKYFIEHLHEYNVKKMYVKWESVISQENKNVSGKHTMSMAVILTADELVNLMLFKMSEIDAHNDTLDFCRELSATVITTEESDLTTRAYDFICGWIAENKTKFNGDDLNKIWGQITKGETVVEFIGTKLNELLTEAGFNYKAILRGLAERDLIIKGNDGKNTKNTRINGVQNKVVEIKINTG